MPRYRSEKWEVSYGAEATYGAAPTGTTTAINIFGAFDDATLPDPEFEHIPMWMYKSAQNRDLSMMYRGRARYSGSIPNIVLLDAQPLYLPIADDLDHAGADPYTHAIPGTSITSVLPSFRLLASYFPDNSTTAGLMRFWSGGKVNRATISCEEGGMLSMSLDEILFRQVYYDGITDILIPPYYDVDIADQSLSIPTREPFYFSECQVQLRFVRYVNATTASLTTMEVPNVSGFRLDINNNLIPKYYLTDEGTDDAHGPYELIEGRREIRLAMNVELADYPSDLSAWLKDSIYGNLLRQGRETAVSAYTAVPGVGVRIQFTRANDASDYIRFDIPSGFAPSTGLDNQGALIIRAPHNIITEGLVSVPMEMICRNIGISVSDHINGTSYPDQNTN